MSRMSSQSVSSYHPASSYLSSWRCKGFGASGSASAAFLALSLGRTGSVDGHSIDRSILCFWRFIYIVSFCNLVPSVHNGWGDLRFFASYHRELHSQPAWSFRKKLLMCNHICHMSYVICHMSYAYHCIVNSPTSNISNHLREDPHHHHQIYNPSVCPQNLTSCLHKLAASETPACKW